MRSGGWGPWYGGIVLTATVRIRDSGRTPLARLRGDVQMRGYRIHTVPVAGLVHTVMEGRGDQGAPSVSGLVEAIANLGITWTRYRVQIEWIVCKFRLCVYGVDSGEGVMRNVANGTALHPRLAGLLPDVSRLNRPPLIAYMYAYYSSRLTCPP